MQEYHQTALRWLPKLGEWYKVRSNAPSIMSFEELEKLQELYSKWGNAQVAKFASFITWWRPGDQFLVTRIDLPEKIGKPCVVQVLVGTKTYYMGFFPPEEYHEGDRVVWKEALQHVRI